MAAARLRRIFQYEGDDSDEDATPWILDEEEQEKVIMDIRIKDEELNNKLKRLLLAFPVLCAVTYLPALMMSHLGRAKLLSLLSMTSLACTAYILMFIPIAQPTANPISQAQRLESDSKPIHRYLSYLNGILTILILLNSVALKDERGVHDGFWLLCTLPAVIFSVILIGRRSLRGIDLVELENLKYDYKGA